MRAEGFLQRSDRLTIQEIEQIPEQAEIESGTAGKLQGFTEQLQWGWRVIFAGGQRGQVIEQIDEVELAAEPGEKLHGV